MPHWDIEVTSEFAAWFSDLSQPAKLDVATKLALLRNAGPTLGRPHADTLEGSAYPNMKELRIKRDQIRVFFAFDPRRVGIVLVAGAKAGNDRFYEEMIPKADALYTQHLESIGS